MMQFIEEKYASDGSNKLSIAMYSRSTITYKFLSKQTKVFKYSINKSLEESEKKTVYEDTISSINIVGQCRKCSKKQRSHRARVVNFDPQKLQLRTAMYVPAVFRSTPDSQLKA